MQNLPDTTHFLDYVRAGFDCVEYLLFRLFLLCMAVLGMRSVLKAHVCSKGLSDGHTAREDSKAPSCERIG